MNTRVKVLWILCVSMHQILVLNQYVADFVFEFAENCVPEVNPLPSLTLQSARNLNIPCRPKRSKAHLLSSS